jgi:DNA topoisomerase-3
VCRHLQQEGRGCDYLILWLDCDREGENICFEVMDNVVPVMRKGAGARQVLRARFSAVSAPEVQAAMVRGGGDGGWVGDGGMEEAWL